MKFYLLLIVLLNLSTLSFAQKALDIQQAELVGKWQCNVHYKDDDDFEFHDQFTEIFHTNGIVSTVGLVKYKDGVAQANVKYEYESKWKLQQLKLMFNQFMTKNYEIDNKEFEQKYEINTLFSPNREDIEVAKITQLNKEKLVYVYESDSDEYTVHCDKN